MRTIEPIQAKMKPQSRGAQRKDQSAREKEQQYEQVQNQMKTTGQKEISLVDSDSRLMRVDSQRLDVCYNIQTSVDAKQHLIVDYDVINNSTDHHQLTSDAKAAKQMLGVERLDVVSDKGFYVEKDVFDCENNGVTVFMPIPEALNPYKSVGVPAPEFYSDRFVYDAAKDVYVCRVEMICRFGSVVIVARVLREGCTGRCVVLLVPLEANVLGISVDGTCSEESMMVLLIDLG